jgi:hypothetical protein
MPIGSGKETLNVLLWRPEKSARERPKKSARERPKKFVWLFLAL